MTLVWVPYTLYLLQRTIVTADPCTSAIILSSHWIRPKNVVTGNSTDPSFLFTDPKKLWTLYWGGTLRDNEFQLLPHHASCPDNLATKITQYVKVK